MERKQPKVAHAINSDHAAGNPSFPWGHRPVHGLLKRKKEKGKKQDPFNYRERDSPRSTCACVGDLELTLSASLVSK